jgi:hypothetical protein
MWRIAGMLKCFVLSRLRDDADPDAYEKWTREVDYPKSRALRSVKKFTVCRVRDANGPMLPAQYVEEAEITSIEEFEQETGATEFQPVVDEWESFLAEYSIIYTEVIE